MCGNGLVMSVIDMRYKPMPIGAKADNPETIFCDFSLRWFELFYFGCSGHPFLILKFGLTLRRRGLIKELLDGGGRGAGMPGSCVLSDDLPWLWKAWDAHELTGLHSKVPKGITGNLI